MQRAWWWRFRLYANPVLHAMNESVTELRVRHVLDVPLHEVSGICVLRGRGDERRLIAVGDREAKVVCLSLSREGLESSRWDRFDLAGFDGSLRDGEDSQIEAICADGARRILVLQERPPRAGLFELDLAKAVSVIELVVEGTDRLAESWADPEGSRGEGVTLMPGGHLLVAKEKGPAALIEFGPKGSKPRGLSRGGALRDGERWQAPEGERASFVALATWLPDRELTHVCEDFSDMEIGPDGRLYLLSDQSATIARIDDLKVGDPTVRLTADTAWWKFGALKGKPEGLAFTADGRAIVAFDKRKKSRNLVVLEPAIAPPDR